MSLAAEREMARPGETHGCNGHDSRQRQDGYKARSLFRIALLV